MTWYWIGPDTMHSVTGSSANDAGLDSDPNGNAPRHEIGDSFELTFNTPGHLQLPVQAPPDRARDGRPSPPPPATRAPRSTRSRRSNVDLSPPHLSDVRLDSTAVTASKGTRLLMGLNERGTADADIYRITGPKHHKDFAGWQSWKTYVGFNHVRFAKRSKHFEPRPGSYVAKLRATDESNNTTKPQTLHFSIR